MTPTLHARLARLGRWPRRVAALGCLALAAVSALSAPHRTPADTPKGGPAPAGIAARLAPGQVAVPVTLSDDSASAYLRSGDRIDLYATSNPDSGGPKPAVPVAARLPVISVLTPSADRQASGGTRVIVAADAATAARVAGAAGQPILAVIDKYP